MVANAKTGEKQDIVKLYDDSLGWPNNTVEKEQAYREGFLEESQRVVRDGLSRGDAIRLRVARRNRDVFRDHCAVYRTDSAGRKTHHLGYRPGHEVYAARLRGQHHALEFVAQALDEVEDFAMFDQVIIPFWQGAVELWSRKPIDMDAISLPPRPTEADLRKRYGIAFV